MVRLMMIGLFMLVVSAGALATDAPARRSIEVSAEGVMDVAPDAFVLMVGIRAREKDLDKARADASRRSVRVIEAAKAFAVDRARTFTSSFMIRPIYQEEKTEVVAHDVAQTIRFTISDVTQAESFTTEVIKAGATSIDSIEFVSKKAEELWQPARKKALENARSKAAGLAEVLSQKIGPPLSIKTQENRESITEGCRWDPIGGDATAATTGSDNVHFVPPANIKVRANVQVEFALVDR